MDIQINRESKTHFYLQIMNSIKNMILKNEIISGYKLPSERVLSKKLNVHRNTVIKAYRMLVDEHFITASQNPKGYFVTFGPQEDHLDNQYLCHHFEPFEYIVKEEFLHMNALFSRLFHTSIEKKLISFATAMPAVETYPTYELDAIVKTLIEDKDLDIYGYSNPQGLLALRKEIAFFLKDIGIDVGTSEITICSETYQALDYLTKLVVSHGDCIIVEEPINPDLFDLLTILGTKVITIPIDSEGMIVDCLENLMLKFNPKFILTIPTFHNPSMTVMSLPRRRKLLDLSHRYNVPIVEINHDSGLRYEGNSIPSLRSMDAFGTVIYIDSFIFKLVPGLKIAYIASSKSIAKKLSKTLEINQIFVNTLSQYIVSDYLAKGYYHQHLLEISNFYKDKRDLTLSCLEKYCGTYLTFDIPLGGSSVWCKLILKINQDTLLLNAEKLGISFAPGHLFYPYGNEGDEFIRISYGARTDSEIEMGIALLSKAIEVTINQKL